MGILRSNDSVTGIIESGYTFPLGASAAATISFAPSVARPLYLPSMVRRENPRSRLTPQVQSVKKTWNTVNACVSDR